MCSCDQGLVTVAFLWEMLSQPQFYKGWPEKPLVLRGGLDSSLRGKTGRGAFLPPPHHE